MRISPFPRMYFAQKTNAPSVSPASQNPLNLTEDQKAAVAAAVCKILFLTEGSSVASIRQDLETAIMARASQGGLEGFNARLTSQVHQALKAAGVDSPSEADVPVAIRQAVYGDQGST